MTDRLKNGEMMIRNVKIPNRLFLGPMAGVTDLPFRILCREQGAGMLCMEMISAKAICYNNKKTLDLMRTCPEEAPVAVQLFGHEPDCIAQAVEMIREQPFDIVDFNMGCPVPKIVNNGDGSALMKEPALIEKIVSAAVSATDRPVTVKIRKGFDEEHINAVECALAAEAGGAAAVAVHARTRAQMYSGRADWSIIRDVVEALKIPVIGNGDVTDGRSALRMMEETGCEGIMVARGAQGNPWIFREIAAYLETGNELERPGNREIMAMILRHAQMLCEHKGDFRGMQEMRKHVSWYLAGFPGAARLRNRFNMISSYAELEDILKKQFPYAV